MRIRIFISSLLILSLAAFSAPVTAAISGEEIRKEILLANPIYDDPELYAYINGLVQDIVSVSELAGEKFTFTLIDDQGVNAFATRGNYVYVNRGLLAYAKNEAELVSVLAHEVGHITKDHVTGQEGSATGAQLLAAIAGMLSGSPEVYEAGMEYANSLIKGHGRNNELEADRASAEYMRKLGYDTEYMIDMLSTMKDMELMQKKRAREQGAVKQTYHGIFSSHPRNDMRLRGVISRDDVKYDVQDRGSGADRYRAATEGLIWGENFKDKEPKPTRYSDMSKRIRFDYPDDWVHGPGTGDLDVTGQPASGDATLSMESMARTAQEPEEFLYNYLNIGQLKDGKTIAPARLKGFTGILPGADGQPDTRIAVVYYKLDAYVFSGTVDAPEKFNEYDPQFLKSIETFRTITSRELSGQTPLKIHYVQVTGANTFGDLLASGKMDERQVEELRLINGYYPAGEPKPGDWIKIITQ